MSDATLAHSFRQLADFAEVRGLSQEAAEWRRLSSLPGSAADTGRLESLARADRLDELPVSPGVRLRLSDLLLSDRDAVLADACAALPWLVRRLLELGMMDSSGAALLARHGIVTLNDLRGAVLDAPADLRGRDLQGALAALEAEAPRVPLGRAGDLLDDLCATVSAACSGLGEIRPAGDVRRYEPMAEWLALAGWAADPPGVLDEIARLPNLQGIAHRTARRAVVVYQGLEFDLRIAAPDEYGTVLHAATGSHAHLLSLRRRGSRTRLCAREEDVYREAGLPWVAPELRQGTGEIEAAAAGTLPHLVERRHIRGDLHMHTSYSDGRDSVLEMVQAATALGYEYIAITDHSERSWASRTVTPETLKRQRDEIARVRERFPGLVILHGLEVDIMPDGRLDFDDRVLEGLDIVLASLHDPAGHDPVRLTERCLGAIRHPLVNVITHPANQFVGRDTGYELDFPAVYEAAALTGTALEIDGAPGHLDLDGAHARQAIAAGVTVAIDSDCHRARLLDRQMRLGVGTARRGWVEPRHVLNTRPVGELVAFITAKRAGRA